MLKGLLGAGEGGGDGGEGTVRGVRMVGDEAEGGAIWGGSNSN